MELGASKLDLLDDESPAKEPMAKRNSLFGDELMNFDPDELENDGWRDVFDDTGADSSVKGLLSKQGIDASEIESSAKGDTASPSTSPASNNDTSSSVDPQSSTKGINRTSAPPSAKATPDLDASLTATGDELSGQDQSGEESSSSSKQWRNPAADKVHREKMVQDIAQLLYVRKKEKHPDDKSISRLKAQARAFESQLYKTATSLETYKDRSNLKRRIAKCADAFSSYFKQARKRNSLNSIASLTSLGSLDGKFGNVSLQKAPAESKLPRPVAGDDKATMDKSTSSASALPVSLPAVAAPLMTAMQRSQSNASVMPSSASVTNTTTPGNMAGNIGGANVPAMMAAASMANNNNMTTNNNNNNNSNSNILAGLTPQQQQQLATTLQGQMQNQMPNQLTNQMGMNLQQAQQTQVNNTQQQQLQQQLLATLQQQQQQQALARQMSMGNQQRAGNTPMMTAQAGLMGNNNIAMLNQLQQRQQQQQQAQTMMNPNLLQQQRNLLQQQQQQQQQQRQQQQQQNVMNMNLRQQQGGNAMMMMGAQGNGLNMMNMQVQNMLPGAAAGMNPGNNVPNMNVANNQMNANMTQPGLLNLNQRRPSDAPGDPGPLSPGSFHW